jgi:uncharacterized protein YidB (DUF937 family)
VGALGSEHGVRRSAGPARLGPLTTAVDAVTLGVLGVLVERLAAAGVTEPIDIAVVRALVSSLASEQIAKEPGSRNHAPMPVAASACC